MGLEEQHQFSCERLTQCLRGQIFLLFKKLPFGLRSSRKTENDP